MRIFQTCFFIIEFIFYLILGWVFAFFSEIFLSDIMHKSDKPPMNVYLQSTYPRKKKIKPRKIIWFIIIMSITAFLTKSFILDIPQLITGKLNYVTGKVVDIKTIAKVPKEFVYLNEGDEVEFFFASDVIKNKDYKIGYLTHTKRAIYCEQINEINGFKKTVGFPFKDILVFLAICAVLIFIISTCKYVKFKLFIPINIISFPTFTYFFIKYGLDNGIWFSIENKGLFSLICALMFIFFTLLAYFIEKRKSKDCDRAFFLAQLSSIFDIILIIGLFFTNF